MINKSVNLIQVGLWLALNGPTFAQSADESCPTWLSMVRTKGFFKRLSAKNLPCLSCGADRCICFGFVQNGFVGAPLVGDWAGAHSE